MKDHTSSIRASHVNQGTSFASASRGSERRHGPALRHPELQLGVEPSDTTPYGGLALAASLVRSLGIAKDLNRELSLLASHRPFHEPDHGGGLSASFRHRVSEKPGSSDRPGQEKVWERRYGKKKAERAIVDLDSCVRPVYGDQKEGTDFTYKGSFGYHPLVIGLAGTLECLRLVNRSGNEASAAGSEDHLRELFPMLGRRFKQVIVRGDSAFAKQAIFDACKEAGQSFAIVSPQQQNFASLFEALPGEAWKPYRQRKKNKVSA